MTIQNPQFKQTYVDFVVEELLPYPLHKHGTRCYVQIEKRNMNTMDLVKKIMQKLNFRRKQLGIAGLKDKHALAKQWICFHNNDIKKYGQKAFLNDLESLTTITNIGYSEIPLGLGSAIKNKFRIRLKYENPLGQEQRKNLDNKIELLKKEGFANYFGEQRFGFAGNNHRIAQDILEGGRKHFTMAEKMFKLQGYASWLFNEYLKNRLKGGPISLVEGDLLRQSTHSDFCIYKEGACYTPKTWLDKGFFVNTIIDRKLDKKADVSMVTGPMIGYNTPLSPLDSPANKMEQAWMKHFELTEKELYRYKEYKLFGMRRQLRVMAEDMTSKRQGDDLLLSFILPKSAYASILVDHLLEIV